MKALALTIKGFEDICAQEINEILGSKAAQKENLVTFEVKDYYDLVKLCYSSQSISKSGLIIVEEKFKSLEQIKEKVMAVNLSEFAKGQIVFAVKSIIKNNEQDSTILSAEIGEAMIENLQKNKIDYKVNLDEPKIIFYSILIGDNFYLILDFAGIDLSKRDYKLFQSSSELRGNLAYCLLRLAKIAEDDTMLDVFSSSGVIPIEAALYLTKKPIQFYNKDKLSYFDFTFLDKNQVQSIVDEIDQKSSKDKKIDIYCLDANFHNISSAKKNAKAAQVHKEINFSRISVDWLDTKFGKGKVSKIVSYLPSPSKVRPEKDIDKIYKEFFYQIGYVLSQDGILVLLFDKSELFKIAMEKERFMMVSEREIFQGEKSMKVLVLKKK